MSMPPDQMAAMMGGQGAPAGGPAAPGAPGSAPMGAPMATPEPAAGQHQAAIVNVQMAINMLEQALPILGSHTDEGQIVLTALKSLSKQFGETKSQELVPAELQMMMQSAQQPGGAPTGEGPAPTPTPGGM